MTISETGEGLPSRSEFMHGMRHSIPFVLGGVAFGIVFGTVAQDSGLSLLFALAAKRLSQDGRPDGRQHWYMFGCGVPIYIGWVVATGVGWFAGNALQYLRSFGLGAALDALDFVI